MHRHRPIQPPVPHRLGQTAFVLDVVEVFVAEFLYRGNNRADGGVADGRKVDARSLVWNRVSHSSEDVVEGLRLLRDPEHRFRSLIALSPFSVAHPLGGQESKFAIHGLADSARIDITPIPNASAGAAGDPTNSREIQPTMLFRPATRIQPYECPMTRSGVDA